MNIGYTLLHGIAYMISRLPYWALYVIADCFYPLVYHVVRYRRHVVRNNLTTAFPEKTLDDIKHIERKFYRWLCDYFVETLKLLTITPDTLRRHFELRNVEQVEQYFDQGRPSASMLGHYCNWEYLSTSPLLFGRWKGKADVGLIYHPLRNRAFDRLFIDIRQHSNGLCVPKKDILRQLATLKREGRMNNFGYIFDQSPKWENIHLWLPFLNHDTPVFTGAERIIRKMQNPVFYLHIERPYRGKYICTMELLTDQPQQLEEYELTRMAFQHLEDDIRREPYLYLWTHDRWKRTHEEYDQRVADGRIAKPKHHS